jgi:hypothetical protein
MEEVTPEARKGQDFSGRARIRVRPKPTTDFAAIFEPPKKDEPKSEVGFRLPPSPGWRSDFTKR